MSQFNVFSLADVYGKAQNVRNAQLQEEQQQMQLQTAQAQQQMQARLRSRLANLPIDPEMGTPNLSSAAPVILGEDPIGGYHTLSAIAQYQKAMRDPDDKGGETKEERYMNRVLGWRAKKQAGVTTDKLEDDRARAAYEALTAPKIGPDGSIMQPRYSFGDMFQPQGDPGGAPGPYQTDPWQVPRAVVTPGVKPTERLNDDVKEFAKRLQLNKVPSVLTSVRNLNSTLDKYSPDSIPGVGYAKNLPAANLFLSGEGKLVKSKIQAVSNDLLNMYSGLAVTLPEGERRALESMSSGAFSAQDFYSAWPAIVSRINSIVGNEKAGTPKEVFNAYMSSPNAPDLSEVVPSSGKKKASAGGLPPVKDRVMNKEYIINGKKLRWMGTGWLPVK